jgi:hypothetical protein
MTQQEPAAGDERVTRLIAAARDLVDAYRNRSTANQHFQELEQAVEALGGTGRPAPSSEDVQAPPVESAPES